MTEQYFRKVPLFSYISRNNDEQNIGDYVIVKNLFKRGKLKEEIFENINFFSSYSIIGDDRPDNVANEIYGDSTLDWLILLCNNILNIQSEWPLSQQDFDEVMSEKYSTYENFYSGIHHYESDEVKNSLGQTIIKKGVRLPQFRRDYRRSLKNDLDNPTYDQLVPYFIEFYDSGRETEILETGFVKPVTNYEYEIELENAKRDIYILKKEYVNVVLEDMDRIMTYKKGGEQYISRNLKRGQNIRIWQN